MNHAPALIYSTHRMLVVWITLAHFHICSLLATLSRYTTLEVWAVRRPMRVCCDSRWEQWVLFINTLDSLLAPCLVYNTAMYIVYGRCGQYGRCMDHTLAGIYSLFLCAASARADVPLRPATARCLHSFVVRKRRRSISSKTPQINPSDSIGTPSLLYCNKSYFKVAGFRDAFVSSTTLKNYTSESLSYAQPSYVDWAIFSCLCTILSKSVKYNSIASKFITRKVTLPPSCFLDDQRIIKYLNLQKVTNSLLRTQRTSTDAGVKMSVFHILDVDVDVVKWRAQANVSMPASYIPK